MCVESKWSYDDDSQKDKVTVSLTELKRVIGVCKTTSFYAGMGYGVRTACDKLENEIETQRPIAKCGFCGSSNCQIASQARDGRLYDIVFCRDCGAQSPYFEGEVEAKSLWKKLWEAGKGKLK